MMSVSAYVRWDEFIKCELCVFLTEEEVCEFSDDDLLLGLKLLEVSSEISRAGWFGGRVRRRRGRRACVSQRCRDGDDG